MRAPLLSRDDAERVAPWIAGPQRGCVVCTQNKVVAVHGGKSETLRLLPGHVVTVVTPTMSATSW